MHKTYFPRKPKWYRMK